MKCARHPNYKILYPPRANCWICKNLFAIQQTRTKNRKKRKIMTKTKTHKLVSPSGKVYKTDNLTKFAGRFHNLTRTGLSKIVNRIQSTHKGWKVG